MHNTYELVAKGGATMMKNIMTGLSILAAVGLICDQCKLLFEVKNDIPVMLIEESENII